MKKIFICLIILLMFCGCKDEKNEKMNSKTNIVSNKVLLKGWKVFTNDTMTVNIPSSWKPKKAMNTLLYVPLDKNKADLYYVILKTDISIINVRDYLKEIFKQMSQKDKDFTYLVKKINLKNATSFYTIDLYSKEENIKYKAYCLIYQKDNVIYDFSYKCLNDEKTNIKNYRIFYNVLFSFEYKYDHIIDSEKFIVDNEELIKYEDL